jgi:hypothetical protein
MILDHDGRHFVVPPLEAVYNVVSDDIVRILGELTQHCPSSCPLNAAKHTDQRERAVGEWHRPTVDLIKKFVRKVSAQSADQNRPSVQGIVTAHRRRWG